MHTDYIEYIYIIIYLYVTMYYIIPNKNTIVIILAYNEGYHNWEAKEACDDSI